MSRSYRHVLAGSPYSEKDFRRRANRKLRRKTRQILQTISPDDDTVFPVPNEVSDMYHSPKDDKVVAFDVRANEEIGWWEQLRRKLRRK